MSGPHELSENLRTLTGILTEVGPSSCDAAVAQAKVNAYRPPEMEHEVGPTLLEQQTSRLIERGYPDILGTTDDAFRRLLSPLGAQTESIGDDIPFLIAFPPNVAALHDQLAVVEYSGTVGVTQFLDDDQLLNREGVQTPNKPYLVVGVDLGDQLRGLPPDESVGILRNAGRTPLTLSEGAALLIQYPQILDFMYIHCAGTVHESGTAVDMYVYANTVKLKRDPGHFGDPRWGTPSCARRVL